MRNLMTIEEKKLKKKQLNKTYHAMVKFDVISHYGGKCSCCGERQIEFLTIDHVNGDGHLQHKANGTRSGSLYQYIKQNGFPKGFQVLCWNCNCAKRNGNTCPHERIKK